MRRPHALAVFVTVSFLLGTILGFVFLLEPKWILYGVIAGVFLLIFAYWRSQQLLFQDSFFLICSFICLLSLGYANTYLHLPETNPRHYIHSSEVGEEAFYLRIEESLKHNAFRYSYLAQLEAIGHKKAEGKLLLSIRKDSLTHSLKVDDRLVVFGEMKDIYRPLNPYQFDYAQYMERKKVLKHIDTQKDHYVVYSQKIESPKGRAAVVRAQIDSSLVANHFSKDQILLMDALLLGQKKELPLETYSKFSEAGVVHILAVSGLHIGILLGFLTWLFRPITFLPKGKIMATLISIVLLWGYAFVAGLSPSVLRAVTMFSFLSFGLFYKRRVFSINMLCLSALVLVGFNPYFIWDVGFQLSYSAVLSILLFYPKLYRLFPLHYKWARYIGGLISVTLTAQLGVLPLSLYYFHQFPGLFFVSNLLIVPFMGLILSAGVIIICLSSFFKLPIELVWGYGSILDLMQHTVEWVAAKEAFVFKHIYFSQTQLWISLLILAFLAAWIRYGKLKYGYLFIFGLIGLQISYRIDHRSLHQQNKAIIFHKTGNSLMGFQKGNQLRLQSTQSTLSTQDIYFLKGLRDAYGISNPEILEWKYQYEKVGDRILFRIDSSGVWQLPKGVAKPDLLMLTQSPKINLERILDSLQPQQVIADGSNYYWHISTWEATCLKKKIPFHYTGEKGAVVMDW